MQNRIRKIFCSYPCLILEVVSISKQEIEILELSIKLINSETLGLVLEL